MASTAAIYVRISKDDGTAVGVARQRAECQAFAYSRGWEVVEVFEDNDVSAYSGRRRPAYEAMVAAAQRGEFGRIIVWRVDRLYRRLADLVAITETLRDVPIETVMSGSIDLSTADGRLHANLLGSVAQHEGEVKAERLRLKWVQRASDGRALGSRRQFGWAWRLPCPGGQECRHAKRCAVAGDRPAEGATGAGMVPHPTEGPLVAEMYRQLTEEAASIRSLGRWLAAQPGGMAMKPTPLARLLKNPRNAGLVSHKGEIVASSDAGALVTREVWDRAQMILRDPARRMAPGRPTATLLGGLLTCPCGDARMTASRKNGRPTYMCSKEGHSYYRNRVLLDEPILGLVGEVVDALAGLGLLQAPVEAESLDPNEAERHRLEQELDALPGLLAAGDLDAVGYAVARKTLLTALDRLGQRQARAVGRARAVGSAGEFGVLRDAWRKDPSDCERLRAVIEEFTSNIEVLPARVNRKPDAADVKVVWAEWLPRRGQLPTAPDPIASG